MSHKAIRPREVTEYYDYMKKLQAKYGLPNGPYYLRSKTSGKSRKNPAISRTKEGLYIHHVGEITIPALSAGPLANVALQEFQEPEMLAYCNIFEHLLAHIMIVEASIVDTYHDYVIFDGAGLGGVRMIVALLNDWYAGLAPKETDWQYAAWLLIKDRRSEYKGLLKRAQRAMCTLGKSGSLKKLSYKKTYSFDKYTRNDSPEKATFC